MNPVTSYETFKNGHFGPFLGRFRVLGHNSGPGPLRTKIFGSGESSHIVGPGKVHSLNFIFFLENELQAG